MTAAIVLWNTVYLERATAALRGDGQLVMLRCSNTCRHWGGSTST